MSSQDNFLQDWIRNILIHFGCDADSSCVAGRWVGLIFIVTIALLTDVILNRGVLRAVRNIVTHSKAEWDNIIFNRTVVRRLCNIVTPFIIYILLPIGFMPTDGNPDWIYTLLKRGVEVYIVIAGTRFAISIIKASFQLAEFRPAWQGKPIKGLMQTGEVVVVCIALILIVAIIVDRSPAILLTGLGASAAVLMLIFKDSILGLVAGVQLAANNMLKVGDWIAMSKYGIDGVVEEVALTTIKIRAWDNTLQTIPPYLLISEPFDNWQAMRDSGGRRIKRSINIDMTSIDFATSKLICDIKQCETIASLTYGIEAMRREGQPYTNLDLYMMCMNRYIENHPEINHNMLVLVRQLQPSQWGLPVEFYCFSADVNWVPYEQLQTEIISFIIASAPHFGLRIHQAVWSNNA